MENIRYLFSDHFAHRENWLTRTETRIKMFYVLCGLILNICSPGVLVSLLLFFINVALLLSIKTPVKTISLRMLLPLFFATFILVIKGLHEGQTPVFSISPLGYDLILRKEGLQAGYLIFFKVIGGVSLILLLSFTTTIADLCAGARWFRIPEVLLELLFLMYRYIFLFLEEVSRMRTAQRCRLGYSTWRKTIHSFGTLGGMLMVRTICRAESTHTAMRSRGYDDGSILAICHSEQSEESRTKEPLNEALPFSPPQAGQGQGDTPATALIKIVDLHYTYPDSTKALRGINLTVKKGDFFGILGPNGSGKTTLLKHLNRLLKPDTGCVAINGKNLKSIPPNEVFSKVGMVFQDANDQLFAPTVEQDVAFGPTNLRLSSDEVKSRVKRALGLVEMSEYARKPIHHLSHGQRKRVCIAGVLAMNPDVLVLDEPTSDLDPAGVTSIMQLLKKLNEERGITIIMATHNVDLVPVFMNHIAIMDSGRIVTEGKPEDIFAVPEIITESKLELPQITQLFTLLRQDVHIEDLPLTIGQARNLLIKMLLNAECGMRNAESQKENSFKFRNPQSPIRIQKDGHGGNITKICATYGLRPENILDFSASINPLGYSQSVLDAIRNGFDTILHYPDTDCTELKRTIAEKTSHKECEIIIGNGSTELIYLAPRALHPKKALVFQPTFSDYANALQLVHADILEIVLNERNSFQFSPDYAKLNGSPPNLIFLCNPNNPTGQPIQREMILELADYFASATIIVDESFMNFVEEQEKYSVLKDAGVIKNLAVICSLTKFFGMPGLRLGFLAAHKTIADKINRFKEPWTVNAIAQLAGKAAIEDEDFIKRSRAFVSAEKHFLYEQISGIDELYPFYPSANFMLVRIDRPNLPVSHLYTQLIKNGLVIRDCSNFRGLDERYFRIAVRTREQNIKLLKELERCMKCVQNP